MVCMLALRKKTCNEETIDVFLNKNTNKIIQIYFDDNIDFLVIN